MQFYFFLEEEIYTREVVINSLVIVIQGLSTTITQGKNKKGGPHGLLKILRGARRGIRTPDPLHVTEML